jgi:hypothetical protein
MINVENASKAANNLVDALKSQPLALALIIVNLMFLVGGLYAAKLLLTNISAAEEHRTELIKRLADKCIFNEQK